MTLQLATIGTVLRCVLGFVVGMVRSAIGGIDKGQMEGGQAIGMSYLQIMLHVIIPQAFRNLIPQIVNKEDKAEAEKTAKKYLKQAARTREFLSRYR